MPNTVRKACASDSGRLMFEHVDRRGRVRLLPLSPEIQKLLSIGTPGLQQRDNNGAQSLPTPGGQTKNQAFTAREWQVFDLLVAGLSSKQIAHELDISSRTVEIHRANLMRKMGVHNTASLIRAVFVVP